MLKERLNTLFESLSLSVGNIAAFAKTDITNISRLKSGARSPKPNSQTVDKLLNGIIACCESEGKTNELDKLISFKEGSRKKALLEFLFPESQSFSAQTLSSFSEKLDATMKLCDVSNITLAKRVNIDSSYLSRIRNGSRIPKANTGLYESICRELYDEILLQSNSDSLKKLIDSQNEAKSPGFFNDFKNWLCDFNTGDVHIKSLLETINNFVVPTEFPYDISAFDFSYEEKSCYLGTKGIQMASIRFLTEVINSGAKEILLYSDRNIDWMVSDSEFALKWSYLMFRLVSNGVKIKIIHNIDRKIPDMVSAVKSWLPIYMSCQIEPYYTNLKSGNRFTHTLFVCPGVACVKAFNLPDDDSPIFDYFSDDEHIKKCSDVFGRMLSKCMPLMFTNKGIHQSGRLIYKGNELNNIEILMDEVSVTVSRLDEPRVSFTILNNLLVNAIKSYCASNQAKSEVRI